MPEGDPAFGQIVGGKLQRYLVSGEHADAVAAQASRQMGQDNALMFELHAKQSAGEFFENGSGDFYTVFFAHKPRIFANRRPQRGAPVHEID